MADPLNGQAGQPVIIGAGVAGLMAALHLAPQPVVVLAKARLGQEAATDAAQGGIAAAVGGDDSPALHAEDTLAAGDGLCDAAVVQRITEAGPAAIEELTRLGVPFDRVDDGAFALGLEAAHGRRRIVHAAGDQSGHAILKTMIAAVRRTRSITVLEEVEARRLILHDGAMAGVFAVGPEGVLVLASDRIVIATGGSGFLYRHTTNPNGAIGQGLALAARAGVALVDMEFVQFHPTALDAGCDPMPLISEAVRGEGAVLIDETGGRFMEGQGRAELEPRDVVTRAVWRHMEDGHRIFLDARAALGPHFTQRFPGVAAQCRLAGVDPETMPIPVRPAAHYQMGGIAVDEEGRSTVPGLWACGEVASTGLHGANRLASNSLLEAAVCGRLVAESVGGTGTRRVQKLGSVVVPGSADPSELRDIMEEKVGVIRYGDGLRKAIAALYPLACGTGKAADPALVGAMVAVAALRRTESRGGHWRGEYRGSAVCWSRRQFLTLAEIDTFCRPIAAESRPIPAGAIP